MPCRTSLEVGPGGDLLGDDVDVAGERVLVRRRPVPGPGKCPLVAPDRLRGPAGRMAGPSEPIQPFMPAAWRVLSSWRPVMRLFLMTCRRRAAEGPE